MMNNIKTPLVDGLQRLISNKIYDALELNGKSLPATIEEVDETGTIVTVNFEIETDFNLPKVQCPVGYPEYIRFPLQKGDKGFCIPADVYMGGMSGLGGGVAGFNQQANLSTLVWLPCGNTKFSPTDDKQKVVIYGPTGVILRDKDKKCIFELTPQGIRITLNGQEYMNFNSNGISLLFGGNNISINGNGITINGVNSAVEINGGSSGINVNGGAGQTAIDGQLFLPHTHTGVTPGSGDSGPVTP